MTKRKKRVLVVGIGNPDRGDDGIGPLVARAIRKLALPEVSVLERNGDGLALIDDWAGYESVVLIDAAAPVSQPGRVHRIDLLEDRLPDDVSLSSTRAFGVAAAVGLARTLGLLPQRVSVYAIEGEQFDPGAKVSAAVVAALDGVVARVVDEVGALVAG
jgi:hydrogenase maturation protease